MAHSATARSFWGVPTLSSGHSLTRAPPSGTVFFSWRAMPQVSSLVLPPPPPRSACLGSIFHAHLLNGWAVALGCLGPQVCWVFWGFTVVLVSGIYKQKMCEGNKDVCLPKLVKHTVSLKKSRKKAGGASDAFFVPTFEFFPLPRQRSLLPSSVRACSILCLKKTSRGGRGTSFVLLSLQIKMKEERRCRSNTFISTRHNKSFALSTPLLEDLNSGGNK